MGKYDNYAKDVLRETFGGRFTTTDDVVFSFGPDAGTGEIDGTIDGQIAVEIGVGSPKQIRASVLDLIFHPYLVSRSSKWFECSTSAAPSSSVAQWKR